MKRNRNDRRRKWWRPRHVEYYRWIDPEPTGDLWIKGPRRIRLSPTWGEVYPYGDEANAKLMELVRVQ